MSYHKSSRIFLLAIISLLFAFSASAAPSAPLLLSPTNSWNVYTTPGNVNFQWSYSGSDINNIWYYFVLIKWDSTQQKWLTVNNEYVQKNLSVTKSLTDANAFYAWQIAAVDITQVNSSSNTWYQWATDWNRLHIGNPSTPTPTPTPAPSQTTNPTPTPGGSPIPTPTPCPTCPTYYIAPLPPSGIGSNSNSGTSASSPWATFAYAIPKLKPGYTLVLLDGTYTKTTSGFPNIICDSNALSGDETHRITIKAQNERKAFLQSDGSVTAFNMSGCSYWNVIGLRAESADNPNFGGINPHEFNFDKVNNVNIQRILGAHNNRYGNAHIINIANSSYVLVEESEAYDYHKHGIGAFASNHITFRRNYGNSRNYADIIAGTTRLYPSGQIAVQKGFASDPKNLGDDCNDFYWSDDSIAENNICEDVAQQATSGSRNRMLGNITLSTYYGVRLTANCHSPDYFSGSCGASLQPVGSSNINGVGFKNLGGWDLSNDTEQNGVLTNVTSINGYGVGFNGFVNSYAMGSSTYVSSYTLTNALVLHHRTGGYNNPIGFLDGNSSRLSWTASYVWAFDNATANFLSYE